MESLRALDYKHGRLFSEHQNFRPGRRVISMRYCCSHFKLELASVLKSSMTRTSNRSLFSSAVTIHYGGRRNRYAKVRYKVSDAAQRRQLLAKNIASFMSRA